VSPSISLPVHKIGQRVLHGGLQELLFDLVDMHIPYPHIKEVMEFQRGLNVKRFLENFPEYDID
jgi:hypothetical protein